MWPTLGFLYGAYCELSTCRPPGFGATPIPWTAIIQFADEMRLAGQDRSEFLYFMRTMDRAFLDFQEKKTERERQASKVRGKKGGTKIGGH